MFFIYFYVDLLAHVKYFEYINDMIRQEKKIISFQQLFY